MRHITHRFTRALQHIHSKWLSRLSLVALCFISLPAFAHHHPEVLTAEVGFVSLRHLPDGSDQINPIRLEAIRETATRLGANGALAWRSIQIDDSLEQSAVSLDHIFDFNQLLLPHHVMPPILVEANNSLNLDGNDAIRLSSKIYRIVAPARFVTAPPNWRNYLWMDFPKPSVPDKSLLPRTKAEARVWDNYLHAGWMQGLTQANEIFAINLNRLKRDYLGMILYRKLLAQHMVSAPYVASADLGVTGNAKELRINDQVLRITAHSALQTDSHKWTPVLVPEGDQDYK